MLEAVGNELDMGIDDKAQEAMGKIKEKVGSKTDNPDLEAEGQGDQVEGKVKGKVDDIKDKFD